MNHHETLASKLSAVNFKMRARVPSAVAAVGFGPTLRAAARLQAGVYSFGYLAFSKHHQAFELLLDFPDSSQHCLQVRSVVQ